MRYILKRTSTTIVQAVGTLEKILLSNDARLIDGSMLPNMAMVEVDDQDIPQLQACLGQEWAISRETKYSVPDTRRRISK